MATEAKEGLNRRRLLKRAGVGAAALYVAPALTSSASAKIHWCGASDGAYCQPACAGLRACKPADNPNCGCFPQVNTGRCFCGDLTPSGGLCDNLQDCFANADCPDGFSCVSSCCDAVFGTPPKCMPHCGGPLPGPSGVKGSGAPGQRAVQ
jgi:hypothetical protein